MKILNKYKYFFLGCVIVGVTACTATPKKEIVISYKYIEKEITQIPVKNPEQLLSINVNVNDNKEVIVSEEDFKKIIKNALSQKAYIIYLLDIVKYYESEIFIKKTP